MESHLIFATEGERFGLPADLVEEVVDYPPIRHLAGLPDHIAGVMLHRGKWLPAIDAAPRFGLDARRGRDTALVVKRGRSRFALTADAVLGIREWPHGATNVITTDLGLVTPVDPALLFRSDALLEEEADDMPAINTTVSIVIFKMNGEEFGTEIANVVEVLEFQEPVHVPRAPEFVEGVVHIRDFVLPIIDLRKRMELPVPRPTPDTRIIVVLIDEERVGLMVDSVVEVAHITTDKVSQPPQFFRGVSADYLHGLARIGERLVIVLRLERILTSQERIALLRAELNDFEMEEAELAVADASQKRGRRARK